MKTIYLDHAATTPLRKEAYNAMNFVLTSAYGNPSSIHHVGREAASLLEYARMKVAQALMTSPHEIVFTSSGTEANNLALLGALPQIPREGKNHVLVSAIEHPSVLKAALRLREYGYDVEYVPVNTFGEVTVDALMRLVRDETALVSIMYANNEIGTIEPVEDIRQALTARFGPTSCPLFHTDACQAAGQLPIAPRERDVDLMTLNSSKLYGPKGVGMLYVRDGVRLTPHMVGGHQESGYRAGTENLAAIVGFAHALQCAINEGPAEAQRLTLLRNDFIEALRTHLPEAHLNGHQTKRLPNNVHLSIPHIEGEALLLMLDAHGICAATGSACTAHDLSPSHVLRAIGIDTTTIHGSVRFSLGQSTTKEDLDETVRALVASVQYLRSLSSLPLHEYT